MKINLPALILVITLLPAISSCASNRSPVETIPLDVAIEAAAENIQSRLDRGVRIALVNFSSPTDAFSEDVLEALSTLLVNAKKFHVIERAELELIRQERRFQLSGEVSDESAQAIGRELGAQVIVSGSLRNLGKSYRFTIKAFNVETAVIEAEHSAEIDPKDGKVIHLLAGAKPVRNTRGSKPPDKVAKPTPGINEDVPESEPAPEEPWPEGLFYDIVKMGLIIKRQSITITRYVRENVTSVHIPASKDGLPVTVIKEKAFENCKQLIGVIIPSSVTTIGNGTFSGCTNLQSVTIPPSVTTIGSQAFSGCTSLQSVTIPPSVTTIGNEAFSGCTNLQSVTISPSVTTIGSQAFYNCKRIVNITIPSSVTAIGAGAFSKCELLTDIDVEIQNNVYTSVDGVLFTKDGRTLVCFPSRKSFEKSSRDDYYPYSSNYFRKQDFKYTVPPLVTTIEAFAFSGGYFDSINIPPSVTTIRLGAFYECNTHSITVDKQNNAYKDEDGVLFTKNGRILVCFPMGKYLAYYYFERIPSSVTTIGESAFAGLSMPVSITIPSSVTTIKSGAFRNCRGLNAVKLSRRTRVAKDAFDEGVEIVRTN